MNSVDPSRREALKTMVRFAYVAPLVASFAVASISVGTAPAQANSMSSAI